MTENKNLFTHIGKPQLALLEELTNSNGVSGNENEIRQIVLREVKKYTDDVKIDAMGNVLAHKNAKKAGAVKVLMAAHMDEIGLMLVKEGDDGLYSFEAVGGIDERQLLAKSVVVGADKIPGVIGCKPIHLMDSDEMHSVVSIKSMYIDVAPSNKGKVKVGDYAAFTTKFLKSGDSIFAKALDDRLGVATLIELMKNIPDHIEFMAAFTVQEELGLRGARVAAFDFNPDLAIVVDSTPAFDLERPDEKENSQYNCRLDAGPAIYLSDAGTISDPRLVRLLTETAEKNKIPYQFRQPGGGGTDAGSIHKTRSGIPVVSVSIPGRYAHTPILLSKVKDWENTILMLQKSLFSISTATLSNDRR